MTVKEGDGVDWEQRARVAEGRIAASDKRNNELSARLESVEISLDKDKKTSEASRNKEEEQKILTRLQEDEGFSSEVIDDLSRLSDLRRKNQAEQANNFAQQTQTQTQQQAQEQQEHEYFSSLQSLVPDYQVINQEPAFIQWLEDQAKQNLITNYHFSYNAIKVAEIMLEFKEHRPNLDGAINRQVVPNTSHGGSGSGGGSGLLTSEQITTFYSDYSKGKYVSPAKAKEWIDVIQPQIDKAEKVLLG